MPEIKPKRPEMGKWGLWNFFAADEMIRPYLPTTAIFSKPTLQEYLARYSLVFIKPDYGWGGKGILKVWRTGGGYAFIRERGGTIRCETIDSLYRKIRSCCRSGKRHVIQEGIQLAKINGRPFDIRLMMMRESGRWKYVGMLAKVAGPKSAVTNIARSKGYVTGIRYALKKSIRASDAEIDTLQEEMKVLAYRTCKRFDEYKAHWQIGLDLAVDVHGKLWMIEENTGPAQSLFARLKDKSMYKEMRRLTAIRRKRILVLSARPGTIVKEIVRLQKAGP